MDDLTVASLLVSRLCHDLAAPAGAVNNGLELLRDEMPDNYDTATMELLEFSGRETLSRLQFFRFTFGAAGGIGVEIPISEAKTAADNFFDGRKVGLNWPSDTSGDLPQPIIKMLLNLILLASEALPRGGEVGIDIRPQAIGVTGNGEGAALSAERREALAGTIADEGIDARLVQAFYAGALARAAGATLDIDGDGSSVLTVTAQLANP